MRLGEVNLENRDILSNDRSRRKTAMIWSDTAGRRTELIKLTVLAGCTSVEPDLEMEVDYVLFDLSSKTGEPSDFLSKIARYLNRHRSKALVWTDMDGLEAAYAALPQSQCHFLVDASDIEAMPILAGAYGRGAMERLHDRNREVEFGSLHRISDELAEFARTLSRMADSDGRSGVSDKPISFRPAPVGGFQPFPIKQAETRDSGVEAKAIRNMIKLRRLRDSFFDKDLFADPAWDILLDLMAATLEGQNVSVSSLCIAAAVPPTTALRWITAMTESGMLLRRQDPEDARRVFIILSDEVMAKLNDYFAASEVHSARNI
jgi:DNA-binding MarR family transcriptional regulator